MLSLGKCSVTRSSNKILKAIEDLDADLENFEFENEEDIDLYMKYLSTLDDLHSAMDV